MSGGAEEIPRKTRVSPDVVDQDAWSYVVATFARNGVSKRDLTTGFTMREIPLLLEHFRRAEARDDLRLLHVRSLPYISEEHAREAAFNELLKRAYGDEAEAETDDIPTYLPSSKPDIAKMREFAAKGDV